MLNPGILQVVAQLVVLLTGGTCAPIEPCFPKRRIKPMLQDIQDKHVIMDTRGALKLCGFNHIYLRNLGKHSTLIISNVEFVRLPNRSHKLFTSGSTGKLKPVSVHASSILHLATKTPATLLLFEIWVTLTAGATVVVTPRHVATDLNSLSSFLKEHNVATIIMTAALFGAIVFALPTAFHSLRHVLITGDHLWNAYGPAECTTLATTFEVTLEETHCERISIGMSVGDMKIFLLDKNREPIVDYGKCGEIRIGGPQQTPRYLDRPSQDAKSFIHLGDLGAWRSDSGCVDSLGRSDTQIKYRGFRVELGEIECVLASAIHATECRVESVGKLPLTANGKVDRKELIDSRFSMLEEQKSQLIDTERSRTRTATLLALIQDHLGYMDQVDDVELAPHWESQMKERCSSQGWPAWSGPTFSTTYYSDPLSSKSLVLSALKRTWNAMTFLNGELSDNTLGLGTEYLNWLAHWISMIFHAGAKVNFCESYREHRTSNVLGACNALRLAAAGKVFHYFSSIDTRGLTGFTLGTKELYEYEPLMPHSQAWTAESMVCRMHDRALPTVIYHDFMSRLFLDQRLEYVTVDYVKSAVMHIASSDEKLGRSYSILSPDQSKSVTVIDTCGVTNEAGHPVEVIEYNDWVEQVFEKQRPDGLLASLLPMFRERVLGRLARWEYQPLDAAMLKFISIWNQKGFYKNVLYQFTCFSML
ncbi:hypothetical protein BDV23DRAFT_191120 [Aspergillus alliaceus]|uniref:AMP-dependent synthetase/ligase domain-containing protein n=1 Tax=Petromyces alliaceus TaxID=209559 RepID=A0A5N7BTZ1_PETAA|nr:hypothetical protein BDV23DRAFT_191120 [Aspergillus alliaceus]